MADPIDIARETSEGADDDYVPGGDDAERGTGGGSEEDLTEDDGTQQEEDHPAKRGSNAEEGHELFDPRLFQVGKYLKGKDNPNVAHISKILATVGEDWKEAGLRSEHETYEHVAESSLHV
jgi:hypothetical protein